MSTAGNLDDGGEYAAHGALAKWQLGNGLWEVAQFNDRLQMERKRIRLTNAAQACGVAADDELCLEWGYGSASANNGNVMEAKQWSKKTAGGYLNLQSTFTYDGRNRLHTFNESVLSGGTSGGAWGQTNGYDRYGNRWATTAGI